MDFADRFVKVESGVCHLYDVSCRNGIVIIDECPGVALDHFEAGKALKVLSSHIKPSFTIGSIIGSPPEGDD